MTAAPPHPPPIAALIVWQGRYTLVDLPHIARLARRGLTPHNYETIALVADQYRVGVAELLRWALEGRPAHG